MIVTALCRMAENAVINDGLGFIYPEGSFGYSGAVAEKLRKEIENVQI